MTIQTTISAIQAINRAISGVKTAPDNTGTYIEPAQVEAAHLPLVLLFPAATEITAAARNEVEALAHYDGVVLAAPEAAGTGIQTTTTTVRALIDAFRARYKTLVGTPEILSDGRIVERYADEGQRRITYRGRDWIGFTFKIDVWEQN